ncbi:MAG: T9SS type A sorting domain-containing protein [Bacteroidota bacterium]
MKTRQLFLLFLLFSMVKTTNAQSYIHFPDSNAVWHETYIDSPPPQIWSLWYNSIGETYYKGDTVINNKEYHKLYQTIRNIFCSRVIEGNGYCGALREDTINRKIFTIGYGEHEEHLLYDFELNVGDTLDGYPELIITSIDTIVTNDGKSRRRWHFPIYYYAGYVIEGIGSNHGLLSSMMLLSEYPNVTMCFEGDSKQTVYINGYFGYGYGYCDVITDSCYYLSTPHIELNEIQVYPNPVKINAIIRIRLPEPIKHTIQELYLINQIGQSIPVAFHEKDDLYFDAPNQPGIYLIQIRTKQQIFTKKIIVK